LNKTPSFSYLFFFVWAPPPHHPPPPADLLELDWWPVKPIRAFDVRSNISEGKVLLVRGREAFEIDDVASTIWSACDGQTSTEQIVSLICSEYQVNEAVAASDVNDFIDSLTKAGLLESGS
ncbi:PqqD family protein, partial [Streptomyces sp. NPDC058255]|uniref:PqqD family protein n=1 Tax=Streptomyces sp. NPDC058255 TaxID=3346407 RepID=UPI0036EE1502